MKIACFTPVKSRQLFLRNCLLQLKVQTHRPDLHYVLVNGENAMQYDTRTIADLLDDKILVKAYPKNASTSKLSPLCIEALLELEVDLFFKIDSDDMYYANYIETILEELKQQQLLHQENGLCINLVDQLWIKVLNGSDVQIQKMNFMQGLGLSQADQDRGIIVGAPPTFVFDRKIASLIVANHKNPRYDQCLSDDILFREILIDNGINIKQIHTQEPVFGYVKHTENSSS